MPCPMIDGIDITAGEIVLHPDLRWLLIVARDTTKVRAVDWPAEEDRSRQALRGHGMPCPY